MKKLFVYVLAVAVIALMLSSCMTMKRDCQGRRHYRLNNGIYI